MASLFPSTATIENDLFAHYGRQIIAQFINTKVRASGAPDASLQAQDPEVPSEPAPPSEPVGILGAGESNVRNVSSDR